MPRKKRTATRSQSKGRQPPGGEPEATAATEVASNTGSAAGAEDDDATSSVASSMASSVASSESGTGNPTSKSKARKPNELASDLQKKKVALVQLKAVQGNSEFTKKMIAELEEDIRKEEVKVGEKNLAYYREKYLKKFKEYVTKKAEAQATADDITESYLGADRYKLLMEGDYDQIYEDAYKQGRAACVARQEKKRAARKRRSEKEKAKRAAKRQRTAAAAAAASSAAPSS